MRATQALIHLDRFCRNLRAVRERIGPGRRICVPVKADAYGHGAIRIAETALAAGASHLAVAAVSEGAELRGAGIQGPILLLSQALPEEIPEILQYRLTPLVSDREFTGALAQAACGAGIRCPVHLKIDTGMGRLGCLPAEAPGLAAGIAAQKSLEYAGTATHLAVADSGLPGDMAFTGEQLRRFREAVEHIRAGGIEPGIVHAANSGGFLLHEDSWFDMVRPGILLYGYNLTGTDFIAEPVMELRTKVTFIKKVHQGESLSYGRTWVSPRDTWIATLPIGYGDGLSRLLSGNWQVLVRDRLYPLVGRFCMDQCMADLGPETDISRWEEVTIFGGSAPSAADMAARLRTIPYEITCNINKRVPRVYVG
ncbi:MAG: alanine racemase [Treponema sp.]|jgi:alanine racemase|nr:alanine racemase [Treponema sp.]